jgi:hypothetical protein
MPDPPRVPASVFVLTVVVALGVCAIAAAVMVPALLGTLGAWPVLVAGVLILVAALVVLWVIQRRRDRTLW